MSEATYSSSGIFLKEELRRSFQDIFFPKMTHNIIKEIEDLVQKFIGYFPEAVEGGEFIWFAPNIKTGQREKKKVKVGDIESWKRLRRAHLFASNELPEDFVELLKKHSSDETSVVKELYSEIHKNINLLQTMLCRGPSESITKILKEMIEFYKNVSGRMSEEMIEKYTPKTSISTMEMAVRSVNYTVDWMTKPEYYKLWDNIWNEDIETLKNFAPAAKSFVESEILSEAEIKTLFEMTKNLIMSVVIFVGCNRLYCLLDGNPVFIIGTYPAVSFGKCIEKFSMPDIPPPTLSSP